MITKAFTWPIDLLIMIGREVKDEVDKEYYDLKTIQQKLANLQMMFEMDEIPEELYLEQEEELLLRYRVAKEIEQRS
ncbi:gas vesicle protein GvpG [Sinobaca sp. H24]|uniref:gas vesicle protein GvpG n=1 Tax=Sinobaca sp. H24 TaxID=2923376 RepID=UPI002079F7E2|nr:gas vesicle protein GvpG [Sinobaca sp. H24]